MAWWIKHIAVCFLSVFCLLFGIHMLLVAWKLDNPYEFFMCFTSSTVIILISATLFFGFIYRMFRGKQNEDDKDEE